MSGFAETSKHRNFISPRTRGLIVLGLAIVLGAMLVFPTIDSAKHGPYSTWFNRRLQRLADEAHLVGRSEADVVRVLGPPTFTDGNRTYTYAPVPWAPTAKFQVHCHDGVVIGVEQFDD